MEDGRREVEEQVKESDQVEEKGKKEGRNRRVTYYMALRVMRLKGNAPSSTRDTVTPGYHLVTTRNKPFL